MTREEIISNLLYMKCSVKEDTVEDITINEAIKALEQTRWIPVSERLPEEGTYLICTDKGYIATIMYDRSMGWLLNANIIAWMPLPEPYKAESEDKK